MQYKATDADDYIAQLPEERRPVIEHLRKVILESLPEGFEEIISYGMLGYVIPHRLYPPGYHCDPKQPLMLMSLASQKNFVAVYSMVLYGSPKLMEWFTTEYAKRCKTKLDMGKSCIRFKKMNDIPYKLIGELAGKVTVDEWIKWYETAIKR